VTSCQQIRHSREGGQGIQSAEKSRKEALRTRLIPVWIPSSRA
jgi:hypothetical protein